ncbi:MAG: 4a-hydroxytetrahydrobiopterin dehydratase [Cyanobacteria bacterium M_surface_10_m1_298]|jgi:4a-hydroxytetrahydrobiopterin dehydratase|nr:4a-hydroxytetrahydrobiopterin dehydratase [Cyanobacteria bacterium M_surface_10_m1_298]
MDQSLWTARPKPDRVEWLERRIEFDDYASNRDFLDRLNDFCEAQGRYPDISFGRTYVNITLRPEGEEASIGEADHAFAAAIDGLL